MPVKEALQELRWKIFEGVKVRDLTGAEDPAFNEAMKIFEETFIPEERDEAEDIAKYLQRKKDGFYEDNTYHWLVMERHGFLGQIKKGLRLKTKPKVMSVYHGQYIAKENEDDIDLGLTYHIAIHPAYRDRGLGHLLIKKTEKAFNRDARRAKHPNPNGPGYLVGEYEKVEDAKGEEDRRIREMRKNFIDSCGAFRVEDDIQYRQAFTEIEKRVPLELAIKARDYEESKTHSIPAKNVLRILQKSLRFYYEVDGKTVQEELQRYQGILAGKDFVKLEYVIRPIQ